LRSERGKPFGVIEYPTGKREQDALNGKRCLFQLLVVSHGDPLTKMRPVIVAPSSGREVRFDKKVLPDYPEAFPPGEYLVVLVTLLRVRHDDAGVAPLATSEGFMSNLFEDTPTKELFLETRPGPTYETFIVRSKDLKHWEASRLNPVLAFSDEDKAIANSKLTEDQRKGIAEAKDINNSDMDLCEFKGKTVIYYSWGNQQGKEFLAEAVYEGTLASFLRSYFP
jgi:hypothetical protein